jgi:hypothetical protein
MDLGPHKALSAVLSACCTAENADTSLPFVYSKRIPNHWIS